MRSYTAAIGAARDELHQLIDQLPDHEVASLLALARGLRATVGEPAHGRQPSLPSVRPTMAGAIPLTASMKLSPKASLSTDAL